jgi:ABC-type lipoprotein release transport system permease subunit
MGLLLKIALRNIARQKRRTVLSAITIAAGLIVYIWMDSLLKGMDRDAIENMIRLSISAGKITTTEYEEEKNSYPLDHGLQAPGEIMKAAREDSRIRGATPRTQFLGQLSNSIEMVLVVGTVIDKATDSTVFDLAAYIEGSYFSADNRREIVLGSRLAADLGLGVGDYVTLAALTRYESRNADEFRICGVLNTTDPMLNRSAVFITFTAADDFLDLEGLVTEINISMKQKFDFGRFIDDMKDIQIRLKSRFPDCEVSTFLQLGAAFLQLSKTKQAFGIIFMAFILIIAAVGIFNSVFMSVCERIREIGVLRAHGLTPREILLMFMLEGSLTGLAGAVLGLVLGMALNVFMVTHGIPFDKFIGDVNMGSFPIWGTIYGTWNAGAYVFSFIFSFAVATLAGLLPARRASKMEVTQAMRFA